jgi:hypothetical protein
MGEAFRTGRHAFSRLAADPASMAEQALTFAPATDAEALKLLRATFPDCPLSARVAALHLMMLRQPPQSPR